jgi:uncharacterized protein (AIM24 family)
VQWCAKYLCGIVRWFSIGLAATDNVEYTFTRVRGAANMLLGGTGFFIDTFSCPSREGILWLHGFGNVFEVTLAAGESIDIEPSGWIYK